MKCIKLKLKSVFIKLVKEHIQLSKRICVKTGFVPNIVIVSKQRQKHEIQPVEHIKAQHVSIW